MSVTQLQKEMAIAVLMDDELAAKALSDSIAEVESKGSVAILPVKTMTADVDRLRVVVYFKGDDQPAGPERAGRTAQIARAVESWLRGGSLERQTLVGWGIERLDFYELPESIITLPQQSLPFNQPHQLTLEEIHALRQIPRVVEEAFRRVSQVMSPSLKQAIDNAVETALRKILK